jgi:hypothetical protein
MARCMEWRVVEWRRELDGNEAPQAIRLELRSISPEIAGAGPRDLPIEIGSDAWGLNPLGDPRAGLARHGESAAPC